MFWWITICKNVNIETFSVFVQTYLHLFSSSSNEESGKKSSAESPKSDNWNTSSHFTHASPSMFIFTLPAYDPTSEKQSSKKMLISIYFHINCKYLQFYIHCAVFFLYSCSMLNLFVTWVVTKHWFWLILSQFMYTIVFIENAWNKYWLKL